MTTLLLIGSVALIVLVVVPFGLIILFRERTANLHRIWDLALEGDRAARVYMVCVVAAFLLAVISVLLMRSSGPTGSSVAIAANLRLDVGTDRQLAARRLGDRAPVGALLVRDAHLRRYAAH